MERKIGEVFQDGDVTLKVVKSEGCKNCFYNNTFCHDKIHIRGFCSGGFRKNHCYVMFIKHNPNETTI